MTYEELGQLVKKKYPQSPLYTSMPDRELATKFIEKYPVYQKQITETPQIAEPTTTTTPPQGELQDWRTRAKAGFATTPEGKINILQKQGLQTRVTPQGESLTEPSHIEVQKPGEEWKYLDKPGFTGYDISDLLGATPEMAGSVAGMAGGLPTRMALSGAGTAAGNLARQKIGQQFGSQEPTSYKEALKAGGFGAAGEAVAAPLSSVVRRGLRPATADLVTPGAEIARKELQKQGTDLTLGQMTKSRLWDTIENITAAAWFGGEKLTKQGIKQKEAFGKMGTEFLDNLGKQMPEMEMGEVVQDLITGGSQTHKAYVSGMYKALDQKSKNIGVSTATMKKAASTILKPNIITEEVTVPTKSTILGATGKPFVGEETKKISREVMKSVESPTAKSIAHDIMNLPDQIPWQLAQDTRSDLLSVGRQAGEPISKKAPGHAKFMAKAIDTDMGRSANALTPEAKELWRSANDEWKTMTEFWNSKMFKTIVNTKPEYLQKVSTMIFSKNNYPAMGRIKQVVDLDTWNNLRANYMSDFLQEAGTTAEGITSKKLNSAMTRLGKAGKNIFFSPEEAAKYDNLVNTLKIFEDKGLAGRSGTMVVNLTQAGVVLETAMAPVLGISKQAAMTAGGVLLTPTMFAKIITNPKAINYFTRGLTTAKTADSAKVISRQIMKAVGITGKEQAKQGEIPKESAPNEPLYWDYTPSTGTTTGTNNPALPRDKWQVTK